MRGSLNTVGNSGLHAIEENKAAKKNQDHSERGDEEQQAGSMAAAGDGPPEAVNDARHRIEAVKPTPAPRDQRRRIRDWRGEHPELHHKGNDVADVAIKRVERRKPQADAER